ncbi:alpha/beta hydrolase [soil metagenome]
MAIKTVRANGIDIAYTAEGAGPPLVMLHGATSSALEDWSAQRPLFRRAFRLYLVDARGHAGTRWDAADGFDKEMLVADLLGFVDALDLATFHLAGFSMGAMTALTFATRHAERLRTAIICGIDVQREPRTRVAARLMDPGRIERDEPAWAAQLERRHAPVQGFGAWQRLLPAIAADVANQDLLTPAQLRGARVPTLLVYGDRDIFVPVDHAAALHRQLPSARLLVAPDCPHQVMVSQPALFNQAAGTFYRSTEDLARARAGALIPPASAPVADGAAVLDPSVIAVAGSEQRAPHRYHADDPEWWDAWR